MTDYSYLLDWALLAVVVIIVAIVLTKAPRLLGQFLDRFTPIRNRQVDAEDVIAMRLSEEEKEKRKKEGNVSSFYTSNY